MDNDDEDAIQPESLYLFMLSFDPMYGKVKRVS